MSDWEYADLYAEQKEDQRQQKEHNKNWSTEFLHWIGLPIVSKNDGIHLIVCDAVDFWPSTGKWIFRTEAKKLHWVQKGRGVKKLVAQLLKRKLWIMGD